MSLRALGRLAIGGMVLVAAALPMSPARADTCVPLPGTSPGATIEVGSEQVRVPSISGIHVCVQLPGLPGIPWVSTEGCGSPCASVVVTSGSSATGYVVVGYTTDGVPQQVAVPIPGTGGGAETCLAGVGAPARSDCFVKVSLDNLPPVPPLPTVSRPPICVGNTNVCVDVSGDPNDPVGWVRQICNSMQPAFLAC